MIQNKPEVPVLENPFSQVYRSLTSDGNALNVSLWHGETSPHSCRSVHCIAGWIVTLCGSKGRDLECWYDTSYIPMAGWAGCGEAAVDILRASGYPRFDTCDAPVVNGRKLTWNDLFDPMYIGDVEALGMVAALARREHEGKRGIAPLRILFAPKGETRGLGV